MKQAIIAATVFCATAFTAARADVVGWWRFNGEGTNVPNVANPGTLDGTIVSVRNTNDVSGVIAEPEDVSFGNDSSKCPTVTEDLQGDAPRVYDPLDGKVYDGGKTLSYKKPFTQGGVMIPYDAALNLTTFTIQAIIRLPKNASSRDAANGSTMFPIAQFGKDQTEGWMFSIYQGYLFSRFTYTKTDDTTGQAAIKAYYATGSGFPSLYDGKWHHVAMVFTTVGANAVCRMFVDGVQYAENRAEDEKHVANWKSWNYSGNLPLFIGANPYIYARNFYGDIAEVRITNDASSKDQSNNFLVPLLDGQGLADDDTALLLTFDNAAKFGFPINMTIATKDSSDTSDTHSNRAYVWYAKNWNILNAASSNPLIPEWSPFAEKGNAGYNNTDALRPQTEDSVCGEMLSSSSGATTNVACDVSSLRFTPVQTNKTNNYVTDVINLKNAYTLPQGSFTVESIFKADTFPSSDTVTIFHSPFLLLCIYQGKVFARGYTKSYGGNQSLPHSSGPSVNDGKWHHAAVTWNGTKLSLYVDGKKISEASFTMYPGATDSDTCFIGAKYNDWDGDEGNDLAKSSQGFKGSIDAVRITRRVLTSDEFLKSAELPECLLDARFDNDTTSSFATGLPDYLAPAGTGAKMSGGKSAPAIVGSRGGKVIFSDSEKTSFGNALSLDGGYVIYPRNRLLERDSFTLEFFGKFADLPNSATFARLNIGDSLATPVWLIYNNIATGDKQHRLYAAVTVTTDGGVTFDRGSDLALYNFTTHKGEWEGWHHWALTVEQQETRVELKLYKDGVNVTAGGQVRKTGQLYLPPQGTSFSFGGSTTSGAYMKGIFDNIRISPGVLDPSEFMDYEAAGMMVILK